MRKRVREKRESRNRLHNEIRIQERERERLGREKGGERKWGRERRVVVGGGDQKTDCTLTQGCKVIH